MTLNDAVIECPSTGICKIDLDLAVKHFNKKSFISEWKGGNYRLVRYTHKEHVVLKVSISDEDALELIERLNLVKIPCGIFKSGYTYQLNDDYS